jgi:hypothetical protein
MSTAYPLITLPDGSTDPRAAETALTLALAGVICPVPFVMQAAAMKIARPQTSRRARVAYWLSAATIVAQIATCAVLVVLVVAR